MPAYEWTCSSCGHANDPGPATCSTCSCPSTATFKQIVSFREQFESDGGTVLPTSGRINEVNAEAILVNVGKAGKAAWTGFGWIALLIGISK
jgi:hypothetical protein